MYRLVEAREAGRRPGSAAEPVRPSGARQRQRQRQASGVEIGVARMFSASDEVTV